MKNSYVYQLIDPNTNKIFYVGKGTKYRDVSHLKPSMWKNPENTTNPFLYYKIQKLMQNGTPPIIERLEENLSDDEAYDKETLLIEKYGRRFCGDKKGQLFNISDCKGGLESGHKVEWSEERRKAHQKSCKKRRKYDPSYSELYEDFIVKNKKRKDIAEENGVSDVLVKRRLKKLNIKKPNDIQYPPKNITVCKLCEKEVITPNSVKRIYCSKKCQDLDRVGSIECDYNPTYEDIYRDYMILKKSVLEIAEENACCAATVRTRIRNAGIEMKPGKRKEC